MKNLRFSCRLRAKFRRQVPPGSARAQPWVIPLKNMGLPLKHFVKIEAPPRMYGGGGGILNAIAHLPVSAHLCTQNPHFSTFAAFLARHSVKLVFPSGLKNNN